MTIAIAERLHPFSHEAGMRFLLPLSSFSVQVFPTRLCFDDLKGIVPSFFVDLGFSGPIAQFTAELDLEQGVLRIFGRTQEGYMRYNVRTQADGIWLTVEKIPTEKLICRISPSQTPRLLAQRESVQLFPLLSAVLRIADRERLSLGNHKAQEWAGIGRRRDFKEIFPLWLRLSQWVAETAEEGKGGNYSLLSTCKERVEKKDKEGVLKAFEPFFLSAFDGILVPRLCDTHYQGIPVGEEGEGPVLPLLTEGAKLIRSLFFDIQPQEVAILPCLPADFSCGRIVGVKTPEQMQIDFEWTKKSLRQMRIYSAKGGELRLKLPKGIVSCRAKRGSPVRQKMLVDEEGRLSLSLAPKEMVHLDRFEN